jgi:hypothetical protein
VGLLVDRISRSLVYATEERIALGADAVLKAIRQN